MREFALVAVVLLLAVGLWWSMITFPKQRAFQKRQKFARALAAGDEVITYGGIIGRVIDLDAQTGIARVEIAEGVEIRILNAALMQIYDEKEIAQNAQMGLAGNRAAQDPAQHSERNTFRAHHSGDTEDPV